MKNKGFTLIEVLGVIVILGIIAVITVPKIKDILEDSKKKSIKASAIGYESSIDKYYMDKVAIDPYYYIPDESYTPEDLKTMGIAVNGTEPDSNSWVTILDNNIIEGCLQFNKYKVNIDNGDVGNVEKGTCQTLGPVSFEEDSWSTIAKAVRKGNTEKYHIGDKKKVKLQINGEEQTFTVRIANMSKPAECNSRTFSQTACGFVVEFENIILNKRVHDSNTQVGWEYTELREYILNELYDTFPSDLKSVMSNTYVVSGHGKITGALNSETNDKLYLLSAVEIYGENTEFDSVDTTLTRQLDYYNEQGVTLETPAKAVKLFEFAPKIWWLRSESNKTTQVNLMVQTTGTLSDTIFTSAFGVSPAFRIDG